jgi:hypothetical protein
MERHDIGVVELVVMIAPSSAIGNQRVQWRCLISEDS